ncbi:hypothetical protein [Microtetraspora sp. NBRC 13810]|uniref:hypothetical protein n=1 Tax=Microtetraspora sp. NBRC 13810 TaxID=3030990 RepID=UPI00255591A6|nr:hypothetical protein [Microtetraspora sp. NBRC 13810]
MDLTAGPGAATELHRSAEALLAHIAGGGVAPTAPMEFNDIEGYWLPPALEALVALMAGEDALGALAKAAQRDEQRTALFLCLSLAVAGQGDRIHASWLGTAFGELSADRPVGHGQRALWLAAARGAYGPAGKIFVLRKLDAVAVPADTDIDRWLGSLVPGEPAVVVPRSLVDFPELAEIPELARPAQAAARLARLRKRCEEITSSRRPDASTSPPLRNGDRRPVSAWSQDEPLAVLRTLIGATRDDGPMGSLTGYLLEDLSPGADPDLAASALHVVAPIVRTVAEELCEATHLDPPATVTVPILGHPIALHPEGPDAESLAAAERQITSDGVPRRPGPWRAYAAFATAAAGLAGVITAAVLGAPLVAVVLLAVATAGLTGLGGFWLWRRRIQEQADAEFVSSQVSVLREMAEGAVWALHEYTREAQERSKQAAEDLSDLTRLIRRGPRAA